LELAAALGPLGDRLPGTATEREQTLTEILDWTGGQPFLTQRLCALVRDNEGEPVAALVQREIVERWQFDDPQEHFKARRDRLLEAKSVKLGRRLGCYQRVLASADGLELDSSEEQSELQLVGVVRSQGGQLRIYNRIYGAVFDSAWVAARLAELRPYEEQLQAWLKSGEDKKYLLRGKALRSALQFRRGKRLATEDENFLLASATVQGQEKLRNVERILSLSLFVVVGMTWFLIEKTRQVNIISQLEQNSRSAMSQFTISPIDSLFQATDALEKLKQLEGGSRSFGKSIITGPMDALANLLEKQEFLLEDDTSISLSWSPDSAALAISSNGKVEIWEVESGEITTTFKANDSPIRSMSWSPDLIFLATGSSDGKVKIWELKQWNLSREVATLEGYASAVRNVSWSPNGKVLATGSNDGIVKLWSIPSDRDLTNSEIKVLATFQGYNGAITGITWSPNSQSLAIASNNNTVNIIDIDLQVPQITLKGHDSWIWSIGWSPDGKLIATGGGDNLVKIWNPSNGNLVTTLRGQNKQILSVGWSADNTTLATISGNETVHLWNITNNQLISTLKGHRDWISSMSWSPDGRMLATGSYDKTVKLWPMTIEGLLDKACTYLQPYLTNPDHPERNTPKVCDYPPSP